MRITVGHIFILSAVGVSVYFGREPIKEFILSKTSGAQGEVASLFGLFQMGSQDTKTSTATINLSENPAANSVRPSTATTTSSAVNLSSATQVSTVTQTATVVPPPEPQKPKVNLKRKRGFKGRLTKKPFRKKGVSTPAPATSAVKTPTSPHGADPSVNSLVGTYVSIELKTGRVVKGVLEGKTATEYSVQLPGLGSFTYPMGDVVKISKAE